MKKSKGVLFVLTISIILFMGAQNALSADNTLDMELSKSVSTANSLLEFNGKLYAGTSGYGEGQIYVYDEVLGWNLDYSVPDAIQVLSLCEYENKLYAGTGTGDGKIYVYDPITNEWNLAYDPPNSPYDPSIWGLCVYDGILYASTSYNRYIYAYDGIDWEPVYQVDPYHWLGGFAEYEGKLFLGVGSNWAYGAIYEFDGQNWVISWSSTSIWQIISLIVYDGSLYAAGWGFDGTGTRKGVILVYDGEGGWNSIFESDQDLWSLEVYGNKLYTGGKKVPADDFALLYSFDGNSWEIAYDFMSFYETCIWSFGTYQNMLYVGGSAGIYVSEEMKISAIVDIKPNTLNLKSKGRWVTAFIELPTGYDVAEIDISTILLQDTIPAELHPTKIGDYDGDGIPDLMVKFSRRALQSIVPVGDEVEIELSGALLDGTMILGTDIIRVIG
ncbi:MAG: hypothetical protein ACFFA0_10930 [Promethearchaeota archaeon]